MKVLFLDIDGVLNHPALYRSLEPRRGKTSPEDWLDRVCVARINALCERAGAVVVISSSWREYLPHDQLVAVLQSAGLTASLIGATPQLTTNAGQLVIAQGRWAELQAWLREHPEVTAWVTLDDTAWGFPAERFVQTGGAMGVTDADVERAVRILTQSSDRVLYGLTVG